MTVTLPLTDMRDCHGVRFCDAHKHLPKCVFDWPNANRVKLHKHTGERREFFRTLHDEADGCLLCGDRPRPDNGVWYEAHHFLGHNRSDERCAVAIACRWCHYHRARECDLGKWVWAFWKRRFDDCDFKRQTEIYGARLPALIAPAGGEFFERGRA